MDRRNDSLEPAQGWEQQLEPEHLNLASEGIGMECIQPELAR